MNVRAAIVIACLSLIGCGGGKSGPTEREPNNFESEATPLGGPGSHRVAGSCDPDDDYFAVTPSPSGGTVTVTLSLGWRNSPNGQGVALLEFDQQSPVQGTIAMNTRDEPATSTTLTGTVGPNVPTVFLWISCAYADVDYDGTIEVP